MFDIDLQRRVQRLLRGEQRAEDLDRIFLGLRERSHGRASIREIGDFVAHRGQRDKGPVTQVVQDMFLSCHFWLRGLQGHSPTIDEIREVSAANLRTATDAQISDRLGLRRDAAKSTLQRALSKAQHGKQITESERQVLNWLGGSFIWNPAFTDVQVAADLWHVLAKTGLIVDTDHPAFEVFSTFLTLHVLALMHGSCIVLKGGERAQLLATFGNRTKRLEVKALLTLTDTAKPVFAPVCIFWTKLLGREHCVAPLLDDHENWTGPLEINSAGKLSPIR